MVFGECRVGLWLPLVSVLAIGCGNGGGPSESGGESSAVGTSSTGPSQSASSSSGEASTTDASSSGAADESSTGAPPLEPAAFVLMESVVYYDGYAEVVDEPVPEGVLRLSNAVHAVKLTDEQLDLIQGNLEMQVLIGALCDNYDRIGSVNIAFTDKGAETYALDEVDRIEIARFITPFMNKNRRPDTVPYDWDIDGVASILTDPDIRAQHDIWFELDVFGVPYAANDEINGCEGRNDVFRGWLALRTDSTDEPRGFDTMVPLAMKETFNDFQDGASDELGLTRKTLTIDIPEDVEHAELVLITSNHGANQGGEEYIRRDHFVYLDGELALQYKPGRDSCEPWRMYNTQGNGIYGTSPRSDEEWQSFSNWCPGDKIDTRVIEWGTVSAGEHEFVIEVPDAEFADDQGNFPFSLYLQTR